MIMINQKGVSLIEVVIVMIVFSMLAIPMSKGFFSVSKSILVNEEVIAANSLTQACAEHILYKRRLSLTSTFAPSANSTECDANTGFTTNGNLSIVVNTAAPLCPVGAASCDEVTISGNNTNGQLRSRISLFLVYNP